MSQNKQNIFFQSKGPFSLYKLASCVNAKIYLGGVEVPISEAKKVMIKNIATLKGASSSDLSFLSNNKYKDSVFLTQAKACLLDYKFFEECRKKISQKLYLLVVNNAHTSFAVIASLFYPQEKIAAPQISKQSVIGQGVVFGKNCHVMANSYIGNNVKIGDNVIIHSNVVIDDNVIIDDDVVIYDSVSLRYCIIGKRVIIYPGVRLGQDGFSYATEKGVHLKIPQIGRVIIGNDVEIGANSTIDRGAIEDTIIGDMTKIDNLVQIGHNVEIGKGCFIVAQVGVAGSTKLGDYVVLGGQVGVAGHLKIGNQVQAGAQAGIIKDIGDKEVVWGCPSIPIKDKMREVTMLKKMIKKK